MSRPKEEDEDHGDGFRTTPLSQHWARRTKVAWFRQRTGPWGTCYALHDLRMRAGVFIPGLLILVLAAFAAAPLAPPYLFASHDGIHHLYRIMEFDHLLKSGLLYPRWAPDFYFGYGYPIFNYVGPLPYYAASLVHFLSLSPSYIVTFKLLSFFGLLLSGAAAYWYARTFLPLAASLVVATVYMYVPYHLIDLYYRGALPEYLAFVWLPLILWAFGRLAAQPSAVGMAVAALAYSGLILTHHLTALLFSPFLLAYAVIGAWRHAARSRGPAGALLANLGWALAAAALALGVSAIYWLPALVELDYVRVEQAAVDYRQEFLPLGEGSPSPVRNLATPTLLPLGSGPSTGQLQGVLTLAGVVGLLARYRRLPAAVRWEGSIGLILFGGGLFLATPASLPLWERVPLLPLAQFPWRALILCALGSAILAGVLVDAIPPAPRAFAAGALGLGMVGAGVAGLATMPVVGSDFHDGYLSRTGSLAYEAAIRQIGSTGNEEFLPRWVGEPARASPASVALFSGRDPPAVRSLPAGAQVTSVEKGPGGFRYVVRLPQPGPVTFHQAYFPGWQALLDGNLVPLEASEPEGLLSISVPEGTHIVSISFGDTPARAVATWLSAGAAAFIVAILCSSAARAVKSGALRRVHGHAGAWLAWMRTMHPQPGRLCRSILARGVREEDRPANNRPRLAGLLGPLAGAVLLVVVWFWTARWFDRLMAPAAEGRGDAMAVAGSLAVVEFRIEGPAVEPGALRRLVPGKEAIVTVGLRQRDSRNPTTGDSMRLRASLRTFDEFVWSFAEEEIPSLAEHDPEHAETVRLAVPIPRGLPPGAYRINVEFLRGGRADDRLPIMRFARTPLLLADNPLSSPLLVVPRPDTPHESLPTEKVAPELVTSFGGVIALVGTRAEGRGASAGLAAFEAGGSSLDVTAGDSLRLHLLWQAIAPMTQDYQVSLRLVSDSDLVYAARDAPLARGFYPTSWWLLDEEVLHAEVLPVAATIPPGEYRLDVLVANKSGRPLGRAGTSSPSLALARVQVRPASLPPEVGAAREGLLPVELEAAGLMLWGVGLSQPQAWPGDRLLLRLLWHNKGPMAQDLRFLVRLVDASGRTAGELAARPCGNAYPTPLWVPGSVLVCLHTLGVDPGAHPGSYGLIIEVQEAATGKPLKQARVTELEVLDRPRQFSLPAGHTPTGQVFGGQLDLRGYLLADESGRPLRAPPIARGGSFVQVTLLWSLAQITPPSYTISVQLLDRQGNLVAQHDAVPGAGRPTDTWLADEVVTDAHKLPLPAGLGRGEYSLIVIAYDPRSGVRLTTGEGKDHHELTRIHIAEPGT